MLNKVSPTPSLLYAENCLPEGPSGCVNLWHWNGKRDHPFIMFAIFFRIWDSKEKCYQYYEKFYKEVYGLQAVWLVSNVVIVKFVNINSSCIIWWCTNRFFLIFPASFWQNFLFTRVASCLLCSPGLPCWLFFVVDYLVDIFLKNAKPITTKIKLEIINKSI